MYSIDYYNFLSSGISEKRGVIKEQSSLIESILLQSFPIFVFDAVLQIYRKILIRMFKHFLINTMVFVIYGDANAYKAYTGISD